MPTVNAALFGVPAQQPSVPAPNANNLVEVAQRLKELTEIWQGARGDGLDRVLTVRDLLNVGAIDPEQATSVFASGGLPPPGIPHNNDSAIPPTPEDLSAMGAVGVIILDWDFAENYTRLSAFEVWRAPTDALGDAILIARTSALVYADPVGMAATFYYWVRAVSDGGVSPFNAVAGTLGDTPPAFEDLEAGTNNGETFGAGIYLQELRVRNGSMTTAKIADLAVVDAKVANMRVDKLLAGSIAVGQYIQSNDYVAGSTGWRIATLGSGEAFFEVRGNAVFGGTVFATAGEIGGLVIGADYIESTNYVAGTSGYRITSGGDILTPEFQVVSGAATFSGDLSAAGGTFAGALSAATGTFAGALSAATGTFAGALSAATGTFAGNLSAAGGTFSGTLTAQVVDTANIVGAAITSASGDTSSGVPQVTVTVAAGDRSLTVIATVGICTQSVDTSTFYAPNIGNIEQDTGGGFTSIANGYGVVLATIANPAAGTYTFKATRGPQTGFTATGDSTIVVIHTKR